MYQPEPAVIACFHVQRPSLLSLSRAPTVRSCRTPITRRNALPSIVSLILLLLLLLLLLLQALSDFHKQIRKGTSPPRQIPGELVSALLGSVHSACTLGPLWGMESRKERARSALPGSPQTIWMYGLDSKLRPTVPTSHQCGQNAAGVMIGQETPELVDSNVLECHLENLRLLHAWDSKVGTDDTTPPHIAPGLHYHLTDSGSIALQAGHSLAAEMLTCFQGRDRTLAGETPFLVVPCTMMFRLDKKAQWSLLGEGGHSDALKMRCPYCVDDRCLKKGTQHESCMGAATFVPQETLGQFADNHNMYLWDVLMLNWSWARCDDLLREFETVDDCAVPLVSACRSSMDTFARTQDWWTDAEALKQPGRVATVPEDLLKRILDSFRDWVPDGRDRLHSAAWYDSQRLRPDLSSSHYQETVDGPKSPVHEPPAMALTVVGYVFDTRQLHRLQELGLPVLAVTSCMLHCKINIIKGILLSIWHDVVWGSGHDEETVRRILKAINEITAEFGRGLFFGDRFEDAPGEHGVKVQGHPRPGGPACDWAMKNLTRIVEAAYPAPVSSGSAATVTGSAPVQQMAAKRDRMLRLAHSVETVMVDLNRCDWSSATAEHLQERAEVPERLARMAIQWVFAFDNAGGRQYGGYYLHDIMHHLGELFRYALTLGFSGLGEISNSVLEHLHQEIGKHAFWNAWIASAAYAVHGEGAFRDLYRQAFHAAADPAHGAGVTNVTGSVGDGHGLVPGRVDCDRLQLLMQNNNHPFQAMRVQLGIRAGHLLCDQCWYLKSRCIENGCQGKTREPAASWGTRHRPMSEYQQHVAEECQKASGLSPMEAVKKAARTWADKCLSQSSGTRPAKRTIAECDSPVKSMMTLRDRYLLPRNLYPDADGPPASENAAAIKLRLLTSLEGSFASLRPAKRANKVATAMHNGETVWMAGQQEPRVAMVSGTGEGPVSLPLEQFMLADGNERRDPRTWKELPWCSWKDFAPDLVLRTDHDGVGPRIDQMAAPAGYEHMRTKYNLELRSAVAEGQYKRAYPQCEQPLNGLMTPYGERMSGPGLPPPRKESAYQKHGDKDKYAAKLMQQLQLAQKIQSEYPACANCRVTWDDYVMAHAHADSDLVDSAPNPGICYHPFAVGLKMMQAVAKWQPAMQNKWVLEMPDVLVQQWIQHFASDVPPPVASKPSRTAKGKNVQAKKHNKLHLSQCVTRWTTMMQFDSHQRSRELIAPPKRPLGPDQSLAGDARNARSILGQVTVQKAAVRKSPVPSRGRGRISTPSHRDSRQAQGR